MNIQEELWGPNGAYASYFEGYEPREEQQEMFDSVAEAMRDSEHLIAEAETGTGKGLAYLTAAIIQCRQDSTAKVGVSTNTINLQEQILKKDLPGAIAALEQAGVIERKAIRYASLKGRSNYLCTTQHEAAKADEDGSWGARQSLLRKLETWRTDTGDRAELDLTGPEISAWNTMSCNKNKDCPIHQSGELRCNLNRARAIANEADIVIVNHALLLADVAAHDPHLGQLTHIVTDEAHHIEEVASQQFGTHISESDLSESMRMLERDPTLAAVARDCRVEWSQYWEAVAECCFYTYKGRRYQNEETSIDGELRRDRRWAEATECAEVFMEAAGVLLDGMERQISMATGSMNPTREAKLRPIRTSIAEAVQEVRAVMGGHDPTKVQWIEKRGDWAAEIHTIPLQVGPLLRERLFNRRRSVVMTSATIGSEPDNFNLFAEQVGFPGDRGIRLSSPFDYVKQALFMAPSDMPAPRDEDYDDRSATAITNIATELSGRTLALFTSNAAIRKVGNLIGPELKRRNIRVLRQNMDGTPTEILRRYRADPQSVILGTNSFWEGVDLAEEGILHAVVICRLPFAVPSDPVISRRAELYRDGFNDYQVPMAVIRFRQGCGRLIRNQKSRGAIIVLDPRIRNRRYGMRFAEAIPECTYAKTTIADVGTAAREWRDSDGEWNR